MGASLPAIVGWIESTPRGVSWWGAPLRWEYARSRLRLPLRWFLSASRFQYGHRYICCRGHQSRRRRNQFWAGVAHTSPTSAQKVHSPRASLRTEPAEISAGSSDRDNATRWTVYVTIALSGATALGAEVVWTRLMGMMLGATVYVFSIILAVFLIGLAIGSGIGAWLLRECALGSRSAGARFFSRSA